MISLFITIYLGTPNDLSWNPSVPGNLGCETLVYRNISTLWANAHLKSYFSFSQGWVGKDSRKKGSTCSLGAVNGGRWGFVSQSVYHTLMQFFPSSVHCTLMRFPFEPQVCWQSYVIQWLRHHVKWSQECRPSSDCQLDIIPSLYLSINNCFESYSIFKTTTLVSLNGNKVMRHTIRESRCLSYDQYVISIGDKLWETFATSLIAIEIYLNFCN